MKVIDLVYEIEEQCEYFARDIRALNKLNQIANLSFRWSIATRRVVEGLSEKISKYCEKRDLSRMFEMTKYAKF